MARFSLGAVLTLGLFFASLHSAQAQFASFSRDTDTILVDGNCTFSNQCTYEAIIWVTNSSPPSGVIWNAWAVSQQDESLGVLGNAGSAAVNSFSDLGNPSTLIGGPVTYAAWHHIAYVYDGTNEIDYVDGGLVAQRAATGNVPSGFPSTMTVGAIYRAAQAGAPVYPSFHGFIRSLRISNAARYSGALFAPILTNFSTDSSTLLLYNFDALPGSSTIADLSGQGHAGTLGVGFTGATSPVFFPAPAFSDVHISGGSFTSTLGGVFPGETVVLQSSTNLMNWIPVQTNTASGTNMLISIPVDPMIPAKFFRALFP